MVKLKHPLLSLHSVSVYLVMALVPLINVAETHTAVGIWSSLQLLAPVAAGMIGSAGVMEWQMNSGLHKGNE